MGPAVSGGMPLRLSPALPGGGRAHLLKGEIEEAKAPLAEARRLNPKLSAKWTRERKAEKATGGLAAVCFCPERRIRIPVRSISCLRIAFDPPKSNSSLRSTA